MDQRVRKPVTVEDFAAAARHQGTWLLRGQPLARFPHRIFPRRPIPLIAPSLKIGLGPVR